MRTRRHIALLVLLASVIGICAPPATAAPPDPAPATEVATMDPAQCGAELPGGRCAEPALPPPIPSTHFYGRLDFHWIPQAKSVSDSYLLSDALRIPSLLHQGCQDYPDNQLPMDGGEGYTSYVAAEAGLLRFLELPKAREQLVRAMNGTPGLTDPGGSHLPGGYVNVRGLSYRACLDQLAPNWRDLSADGVVDTTPGWRRVITDLMKIPALIGQPGTDGAHFCHNNKKHTDWDFTMALVIRVWGLMKDETDAKLGLDQLGMTRAGLEKAVAERAWLQGAAADIDHTVCPGLASVPETENHEWLIRTTRLLHNELLPRLWFQWPDIECSDGVPPSCYYPQQPPCGEGRSCPPPPECNPTCKPGLDHLPWPQVYNLWDNTDNNANGLNAIMHRRISDLLGGDWLEYNARPYSRAQMVGLLNLHDFSTNAETKRLAERLLNFAALKHVAESMDNLRIVPFRRRAAADNSELFDSGTTGPMFQVWLGGAALPQYPSADVAGEMALAAESAYRPPDWLAQTMFDRDRRDFVQGFDGQGQNELAYGGPDFVITGGGQRTNCPYPSPLGCLGSGNDPGTTEPIVLIPRRNYPNSVGSIFDQKYDDLIRIAWAGTCLDRNFACGPGVVVPDNLVKDSGDCKVVLDHPGRDLRDVALRLDQSCNPARPSGTSDVRYDGCLFVYAGRFYEPGSESEPGGGMGWFVTHTCSPSASEPETARAFHAFVNYMRTTGKATARIDRPCDPEGQGGPGAWNPATHIGLKVPPATPVDLTGVTDGHPAYGYYRTCIGDGTSDGGVDGRMGGMRRGTVSGELTLDGDTRYTPTGAFLGPRVISRPTTANVTATAANTSYYGETVALEATVTPVGGRTGAGGSVTFYDGVTELGTVPVGPAGEGGVVRATLNTSTLRVGRYRFTAAYSGDARFNVSVSDVDHTVLKAPTALAYTGPAEGAYHEEARLAATLTNAATGGPIAGAPVAFALNNQETCSSQTDASGVAPCVIIPNEPAGEYQLAFSYAGDDNYLPTSGERPFTVLKERTALTYTGTTHIANGTPARSSGVLREDGIIGRAPIAGRTVAFALGSGAGRQSCTASTTDTGAAECTIASVDQPLSEDATVPVTVTFGGDPFYLPSEASAVVKLQYMTGRASGLAAGVHLPLVSLDLEPTPDTGPVRTAHAGSTNTPCTVSITALVLSTGELCVNVTTSLNPGTVTAVSTASDTTIGIPGIPVITLSGVRAESTSRCGNSTGATTIAKLTIAGQEVTIPSQPNSTINLAGGAQLTINEQKPVPGADNGLAVTAVHLTGLGGLVDVQVGSATSAVHNCG